MGANNFSVLTFGKTAKDAFRDAVQSARYEYGHGGYTGTIAEKHEFDVVRLPKGKNAFDFAHEILDDFDKWGPAGCIEVPKDQLSERQIRNLAYYGMGEEDKVFYFFGWASS